MLSPQRLEYAEHEYGVEHRSGRRVRGGAGGFRGYLVVTAAFYGPDDRRTSKVVVGIVTRDDVDATVLDRWFPREADVRDLPEIVAVPE